MVEFTDRVVIGFRFLPFGDNFMKNLTKYEMVTVTGGYKMTFNPYLNFKKQEIGFRWTFHF